MSPLVSVIMPLYNHCIYVTEAVNSILNQTHRNIELIIVDDGSTDGSSDIAKKFSEMDNRIIYLHQQNSGTGVALNNGFSIAKGEYGTWVSSDNIYYPKMLETFLDFLKAHDASFVFSAFDMNKDNKHFHTFRLPGIDEATILSDFIERSTSICITGMCYLYNMSLKNECGDFLDVPGEDYYMGVVMGLKTDVGYIPTPLGMYRIHDNSVSGRLEKDSSPHIKGDGISAVESVKRLILKKKGEIV